jgi:predicted aminopeptidase
MAGAMGLLGVFLCGCGSVSYYGQAIRGQYQIVARRQAFDKVFANTNAPAALKEKLRLVQRLRTFAETELALPANGHYQRYADLQRRYVVWNVHAAPADSLDVKSWWYPVVGRLKYRGYFSEEAARRYGARLAAKSLEVYVEGVEAYSTLGWFRDPVLNTFIHHGEADLAETIFHELAHQRLFVGGDTDFDEAFATCVGQEATGRWLRQHAGMGAVTAFEVKQAREMEFATLVQAARGRLQAVYNHTQAAGLAQAKQEVIEELRQDYARLKAGWSGWTGYDAWFAGPLNNAQLATISTYYRLVPAFRQLLAENGGDLEKFYVSAAQMAKRPKSERAGEMERLLAQSGARFVEAGRD